MAASWLNRGMTVLGQRVPVVVVGLVGAIFGTSILGAIFPPVVALGALGAGPVWSGQVWRLLTWSLIEREPLNLLFGCYAIWWVGVDLARAWGGARFLKVCLTVVALSAGITCVLALFLHPLLRPYLGVWPLADALIIAWSTLSPYGIVRLFLILPVPSRSVPLVIIALTVVYAIFDSFAAFVPHFLAEGLILLYLRDVTLRTLWLKLRFSSLERKLKRHASPLREVKRGDSDPPRFH